jgi:DNA replication ATP-dependent helicase Dna2
LTHKAINNALNKIRQVCGTEFHVCKIGQTTQGKDLVEVDSYEKFVFSPFKKETDYGYAIGATPFATGTGRLSRSDVEFDVVIFDEASQITLPLALMAMLSGKRYIFIGDDKQLGPIFSSTKPDHELAKSVFEKLLSGDNNNTKFTMLNETYRLNKELAEWPSKKFYNCKLKSHPKNADSRLQLKESAKNEYSEILDPNQPCVFVKVPCSEDICTKNENEAALTVSLIKEMLARDVPPDEIAVISPFRHQNQTIRSKLHGLLKTNDETCQEEKQNSIIVDTVERMQGQERSVIIFSLVSTNIDFIDNQADFFLNLRRLNVAITRAKNKLIVLSGLNFTKLSNKLQNRNAKFFKDFIGKCKCVNSPDMSSNTQVQISDPC